MRRGVGSEEDDREPVYLATLEDAIIARDVAYKKAHGEFSSYD